MTKDLPEDVPPILPNIEEQLKEYLICPEKLPLHDYRTNQELWPRKPNPTSLFHYEGSPLCSTLKVQRDLTTGEITEFYEVPIQTAGATAQNSMSFARAPLPPSEATRGTALNIPFWPGGFPDPVSELTEKKENYSEGLLTVPPGFERGLVFEADGITLKDNTDDPEMICPLLKPTGDVLNLMDIVKQEQDFLGIWKTTKKSSDVQEDTLRETKTLPEEEEIIPNEAPILKISETTPPTMFKDTEWAIRLDCSKPVLDFEERIPEMAYTFKFELDTFQKLAILQLEQHNHVFVAAHTSAGKTVVAEYAIALSRKHMTRTIYTSPIKALSNQKYRDFKRIFKDVGLITGDTQINQTAACLIMTTEILRSMLYNGSDVTRDLEYVIFDEVHYINDAERGHVWEQVLILLPAHVTVVLLSATAPNTMEFADWLGRTKQKKVYVVTTSKRPVPLHHYLYTGTGGTSKDKMFLVLEQQGWHQDGYTKAMQKEESAPKTLTTNYKGFNAKQEKTLWCALIDHLKKRELLPVVAFTFSRSNCDQSAKNLIHLDLTKQKEKSQIRMFFEDCVKSLKEPDRNLPQIMNMREILLQGIGVHHSGILPLIKEVVEMLFQKGLVKLLFATETFAMGVNMPARTVIFNSIRKHDGQKYRNLLPAEYIQMAGRAGRRGLDKEGTVIILCKKELPPSLELREMMTGKPSQLQSQFRLTYGMVLSLLRVESLSVEGMISRSFREADHQKKMEDTRVKLQDVEKKLVKECSYDLSEYLQPLIKFYVKAREYIEKRIQVLETILSHHKVTKEMIPGRVLLITHGTHLNKLGVLLAAGKTSKAVSYKVLVLTDDLKEMSPSKPDMWYKMLSLATKKIFSPIGVGTHTVLTISQLDIWEICSIVLKINADLVLKDWEKRQIPRFKDDPPGQSCNVAVQELTKLTISTAGESKDDSNLKYLHFLHDLKINDQAIHEKISILDTLREKLHDQVDSVQIPNFEDQFISVFKRKYLEDQKAQMNFELSHASMALYPDYESRIQLLKRLNYVDAHNRVELKGRVACEMGMNELMITEIVFRNVLNKLKPAEVAALLSSLIFQAKTKVEPDLDKLPSDLLKGKKEIEKIFNEIQQLESVFRISNEIGREEELNFGLVQIVYEWASDKPFSEIMQLTDVQEGIIVRCIQQLNDIICDVRNASRLIGDPELQSKMEEASLAIKRDIVFAASLYTQREAYTI